MGTWRALLTLGLTGTIAIALASLLKAEKNPDSDEWLPLSPQSLLIDKDSPLNLSSIVPSTRFNCGMLQSGPHWRPEFPDHTATDQLVEQLERHGYNLVRIQYIDYRLFRGSKIAGTINPDQLDRFYYLLSKLKEHHIRWGLDILSRGEKVLGQSSIFEKVSPDDMRVRLHFDPKARRAWLDFVDAVYAAKNPYTGSSILADPNLLFVSGANENTIAFSARPSQPFPTGFDKIFAQWLKSKAGSGETHNHKQAYSSESLTHDQAVLPKAWDDAGANRDLLLQFVSDLEVQTYQWMQAELGQRGFHGELLQYHETYNGLDNRTRSRLPIIDVHSYAGDVSNFAEGSHFVLPDLATSSGLNYALISFAAQWAGKPMVMSEYGQPYPNELRFQSGVLYPALAGYQGIAFICRTAEQAVENEVPYSSQRRNQGIRAYDVGLDPVERVNETLATFLFGRGDISPARSTVAVPFSPSDMKYHAGFLTSDVRRSVLLSRLLLFDPKSRGLLPQGAVVMPMSDSQSNLIQQTRTAIRDATGYGGGWLSQLTTTLREKEKLRKENRTNVENGLYENDTGEIFVDTQNGTITVDTPKTKAVAANSSLTDWYVGVLRIEHLSGAGLVAAVSLDNRSLDQSSKILLMLSGDVQNTRQKLDGDGTDRILRQWGAFPLLMKRRISKLSLPAGSFTLARLSTLSLNGDVLKQEDIPVISGRLHITLDVGDMPGKPTNYWVLEPINAK